MDCGQKDEESSSLAVTLSNSSYPLDGEQSDFCESQGAWAVPLPVLGGAWRTSKTREPSLAGSCAYGGSA
jgi:hypothetical protein